MPDFYFRGTLAQFWQFTFAEYDRLSSIFGKECFEFFEPSPKKVSLIVYEPKYYDQVHFIVWDAEHRDFPVRVKASASLGSDLVEMYVSIYVSVLQTLGDSCLDVWNAYIKSLEDQGFLLKPADFLASLPSNPPKPKSGADLDVYFDRFHKKKKEGPKYTLLQIAAETGFGYSYVRQLHSNYLKARGLAKPEKRTNKRTNKN